MEFHGGEIGHRQPGGVFVWSAVRDYLPPDYGQQADVPSR
jgi:hypothetical protein